MLEQEQGKTFKVSSSDFLIALRTCQHFSQVQWILLGTSIVLLVTACIFIFTGGNLWFHSDSAAYVNQAAEQIRSGEIFPKGWYGSTGLPWLDFSLFFTMRIFPDWLIARDWAQISFLVLCLISVIVFSRKVFHNNCWLLIVPVVFMFLSQVQYDMMYAQCAYTNCIIAIFLVLSSFFNAVTVSDNYLMRSKLQFSVFLITLFAMSLGGILMIQQITLPLLGALFLLYIRKHMEHKSLCPPQIIKFLSVSIAILFSSGFGYICSKFLYAKMNIAGNMGLTQLASNLESIIQNINTSILGFLLYVGFQQGNFIFSLAGIQTLLRLFFMVAFTFVFPIIACKNFRTLCKQMQFFILFVLLHCLEVYTILIFGIGVDISASARYQLTSITLLNTVSCIYIYNKYIKEQRLISYIYTLVVACVALISTLPILNMGNYPEQLAQMRGLTTYLEENNLNYGYSTFWNAGKNTVLSNGRVQINAVNISNGQLYKYLWLSSDNWYDPNNYIGKTFLLLAPDEAEIYAPSSYGNTSLGAPEQVLSYDEYIILVYDYNISSHQFGAEFDGDAEYIWKMNCSDQAMMLPDGSIQISEGQLMYGPYIDLEKGIYTLTIDADFQEPASVNITAESGKKIVQSIPLVSGKNTYTVELVENMVQVEFTVRSISDDIITVRSVHLKKGG